METGSDPILNLDCAVATSPKYRRHPLSNGIYDVIYIQNKKVYKVYLIYIWLFA